MPKYISLLLIIIINLAITPAYSCMIPTPPQKEFEKSDVVFTGTLKKLQCELTEKPDTLEIIRTYKVESIWKGTNNKYTTKEVSRVSKCDDKLCKKISPKLCEDINSEEPIGTRYLIYAYYKDGYEFLTVDSSAACGHSTSLPSYWDTVMNRIWFLLRYGDDIGMGAYYNVYVPGTPLKTF